MSFTLSWYACWAQLADNAILTFDVVDLNLKTGLSVSRNLHKNLQLAHAKDVATHDFSHNKHT